MKEKKKRKEKRTGAEIVFDPQARNEFVTGFRKRARGQLGSLAGMRRVRQSGRSDLPGAHAPQLVAWPCACLWLAPRAWTLVRLERNPFKGAKRHRTLLQTS